MCDQPLVCKNCWPKADSWVGPCPCVNSVYESGKRDGAKFYQEALITMKKDIDVLLSVDQKPLDMET
jgi:hypothetical protein